MQCSLLGRVPSPRHAKLGESGSHGAEDSADHCATGTLPGVVKLPYGMVKGCPSKLVAAALLLLAPAKTNLV